MSSMRRQLFPVLVAALSLPAAAHGQMADFDDAYQRPSADWNVFTGVRWSSNVSRAQDGGSGTLLSAGAGFDVQRATPRLQLSLNGSLGYEDTSEGQASGGTIGAATGTIRYAIVPQAFQWIVTDTFGQTLRNALGASSVDNRSSSNLFSTGPDLEVPLGGVAGLRVSGRFSDFDSGESDAGFATGDERTLSGSAGLFRRLSPGSELGAHVAVARVEAPGFADQDYDQRSAYLRLWTQRARYSLALDGGVTEVRLGGVTERSPLVHLDFYRELSARLSLNVSGGQEFRSAGDRFRDLLNRSLIVNGTAVPVVPNGDGASVAQTAADIVGTGAVRTRYARVALGYTRARTDFQLRGEGTRERTGVQATDPANPLTDRNAWSGGLTVTRRLRANLVGTLGVAVERREFVAASGADRTTYGDASLGWRITRNLQGTVQYRYEKRATDFDGFAYSENTVYVGVSYGSRGGAGAGN